jgi:RNA polymerase sigma-70 factor (ECF subfamily)
MESEIRSRLNSIGTAEVADLTVQMMPTAALPASATIDATGNSALQRDQLLVRAAQSGCRNAFDELMSLYRRRVYRTILPITKNVEDAEDAMQDTFFRAFLAIGRFEGRASFYSWVTRIAINSALMVLRRRRNRNELSFSSSVDGDDEVFPMDVTDSAADPEEACSQQQHRAILSNGIEKLSPSLREVVRARVEGDCSIREIAKRCNISEAAAKSRILRARRHLDRLCAHTLAQ